MDGWSCRWTCEYLGGWISWSIFFWATGWINLRSTGLKGSAQVCHRKKAFVDWKQWWDGENTDCVEQYEREVMLMMLMMISSRCFCLLLLLKHLWWAEGSVATWSWSWQSFLLQVYVIKVFYLFTRPLEMLKPRWFITPDSWLTVEAVGDLHRPF